MSSRLCLLFVLLCIGMKPVSAQLIWTDASSDYNLPDGVKLFTGTQENPALLLHYFEVDMTNPDIIVHPFFSSAFKATSAFSGEVGAYGAVNGGFFSSTASVSTLVEAGEVKAQNIQSLSRDGITYPATRAFFGIQTDRTMSIDWIYHFSSQTDDLFRFSAPAANVIGTPAPIPVKEDGLPYTNLLMGIGGGPNLVTDGQVNVTYDEEVFFGGSGLEGTNNRARTAVGYTPDQRVIMLVADSGTMVPGGRFSSGVTLQKLAEIMIDLGCIEAINLDGGGSSTVAVNGMLYNKPQGGTTERSVPTILAVVPIDSLRLPVTPLPEIILDTEMEDKVVFTGEKTTGLSSTAWFQTANAGFYGESPSWLRHIGSGSDFVTYMPDLLNTEYEVFGWWTASFNRAEDTPYIIHHAAGIDTVRMNQKIDNAQWVSLGTWDFSGTENDKVIISNDANDTNELTYVVADGIRFVQTKPTSLLRPDHPNQYILHQNYPNPFNPSTRIPFRIETPSVVTLTIYDINGRIVTLVYNGFMHAGDHSIQFDASTLSSGIYIYELKTDSQISRKLMSLIK